MDGQRLFPALSYPPRISIVIEWDNPVYSDLSRAEAMLQKLGPQLAAWSRRAAVPPELIFVCDPATVEPAWVEAEAHRHLDPAAAMAALRVVSAPGLRYYEMKNAGAGQAIGEVVVFLDSDVVPEDGWLDGLVSSICRQNVAVVGGATHLEANTLYQRAVALFWFFPLRSDDDELVRARGFLANNVAFRREVILEFPFSQLPTYRAQTLARTLRAEGYAIYRCGAARTEHPAPNGLKHFAMRAFGTGYDRFLRLRDRSADEAGIRAGGTANHLLKVTGRFRNIWRHRRQVNLPVWQMPVAFALAVAFYGIALLGMVASLFNPRWLRRLLGITPCPSAKGAGNESRTQESG